MKLYSAQRTARRLRITPQRLRQPDMDRRLEPIRLDDGAGPRVYRDDLVLAELDRRADAALAKKGTAQ